MDSSLNNNLLNRVEAISSAAHQCGLNFDKLKSVGNELAEISGFLEISSLQAIYFSCLTELSFHKTVTLDMLSKHFKCSVFKLVSSISELEALEKKGYLQKCFKRGGKKRSYNDMGFLVPHYVVEAIRKGDASMLTMPSRFDLPGFLKQVSSLVEDRLESLAPTSQIISETEFLISINRNHQFIAYADEVLGKIESKCLLFWVAYMKLKGQWSGSIDYFSNAFFDDLSDQLEFAQQVFSGKHELIMKDMIQLVISDFDGEKKAVISQSASKVLYKDYPDLLVAESTNNGIIKGKGIVRKTLFFNDGVLERVRTLESALKPEKFKQYRQELQKNKLSKGITAIFFGDPGTGKTEAVYQLARKTGRDIMMVDLSQTKSKWFGESEKMAKKIFDDYSSVLSTCDLEPILFINEADGIFTKRIDLNTSRGSSAEQAINTMQNIFLQSMENFEGILIATTNLTGNLDRAFERRFTFRIDFPRPDEAARKHIWRSKIFGLTDTEAAHLAGKFEMTGGEIDVQVRQILLKKVLDKKANLFEAAIECCSKNHGFSSRRKVGF
ncbi:MAG: ATP-binding protein [Methanosarcina sp.]